MTGTAEELLFKCGQGNWGAFGQCGPGLAALIKEAAEGWRAALRGVKRPWLCWNVSDDWCLVQQRLVSSIGWTPVVGFDSRVGPPRYLATGAVVIDFNRGIGLPVLYPHFPLEFAFLFIEERLAVWHSDLLIRRSKLEPLRRLFELLADGETAANLGLARMAKHVPAEPWRYWELVGCTTTAASRDQFEKGTGWWMEFWNHPNCPGARERDRRRAYYWDHGAGIYYWHKVCGGRVVVVDGAPLEEGHCTKINNPSFKRSWLTANDAQRRMSVDLAANFDLSEVCHRLDLVDLLKD